MSAGWPSTDTCPQCAAQLAYQSKGRTYSRCIGVEVEGIYDGILYWQCPMCGHKWHRFPSDHRLTVIAERFVNPGANDV